jgi:hypothetical protein
MDVTNETEEVKIENYKNKSITQYEGQIKELIKEKREYIQKIDYLQHSIRALEEKKAFFCHSMGGHKWVTEREGGLYGESFTYCEICKKER